MDPRVRKLLELLGADSTDQVLTELAQRPSSVKSLEAATGIKRQQLGQILNLLLALGVVTNSSIPNRRRGPREKLWSLRNQADLERLEQSVEAILRGSTR